MPWYAGIIFRILTYLRMQCTAVHQFRVVVTVYVCAAVSMILEADLVNVLRVFVSLLNSPVASGSERGAAGI